MNNWPPDYVAEYAERQRRLLEIRKHPHLLAGAKEFYKQPENASKFIQHWCVTYDPRNAAIGLPTRMPFVPFLKQHELVGFIVGCMTNQSNGLIEKCRDMGATWICCAVSVWAWLFIPGVAIGWGSRKEEYVDKLGDPKTIFDKIRTIVRFLPNEFVPAGYDERVHATYMRLINPENGSTVIGEAGDNIGRGGRTSVYFKDESAHYERPELIQAALDDNTNVQIDISSVNGPGNVFHRKREAGIEYDPLNGIISGKTNVFVMDWRDHPAKTDAWYEKRKKQAEDEGLVANFAQEVDRNYFSALQNTLIKPEWVAAAIDSHIALGIDTSGQRFAALDVADEGPDTNAWSCRRSILLDDLDEWGSRDTGVATRRVVDRASEFKQEVEIQYDCIGVGAGVKAEVNRLADEGEIPPNLIFTAWSASAKVLEPDARLLKDKFGFDDEDSPINSEFFSNLKVQGWWSLARRFEKTYKALKEGVVYPPEDLISISSDLPAGLLAKLKKELCQVTAGKSTATGKMLINKSPPGTKSPNLADSVMMNYWPLPRTLDVAALLRAYG